MTLGVMISQYITAHGLTYAAFASQAKLTKGYVSMLVNNKNPKTGKPPVPQLKTYNNIAQAMGMTLEELFSAIDDAPVDISNPRDPERPTGTTQVSDTELKFALFGDGAQEVTDAQFEEVKRFAQFVMQRDGKK